MTGPVRPSDLPPAARAAVAAVDSDASTPVKLLLTGGLGTGKSTTIAAVRTALRTAGRTVLSRPPRPGDPGDAVLVIDDADLLDDAELAQLTDTVAEPSATVVVAARPLTHRPALVRLTTALGREQQPVRLGPLPPVEIARTVAAVSGTPPDAELVTLLGAATAGLPFLVRAVMSGRIDDDAAVHRAARVALLEQIRPLDERLLDTLLVCSLGDDLGPDDVAAALRVPSPQASADVDRARATGLLDPAHPPAFLLTVHDAVSHVVGAARHHDVEVALLSSQLDMSTLTTDLALRLAEHGMRDDRLGAALSAFAAAGAAPARAARLYRAAADAGAAALSAPLAEALALTGDCAAAGHLADQLLTAPDAATRAAAVRIAGSIAVHDGSAAQGHALFGWLGEAPDAVFGAAAAMTALAAGDAAALRAAVADTGPPTSTARAARALADGLALTVDQPYTAAMATLSQALSVEAGRFGILPDTPAAVVTLAALHGGDPVRATSVIGRVLHRADDARRPTDDPAGGAIFVTPRHRLLLAWAHMQDARPPTASGLLSGGRALHRREALWSAALQTAIARRNGDIGAMQTHWYAAMEVLTEYQVDVLAVLPLGELWIAAARMRQLDRVRYALDELWELLAGLGDPVLWSVPLHWAGVHAGILANDPEAVAPHGQALTAAAAHSSFARALATGGRTWLRVLAGQIDADEVGVAARALARVGHTADATRLAGQAALQAGEPRVSQAMLQLARDLKQSVAGAEPAAEPAPTAAPGVAAPRPAAAALSDREREVAELLLAGLPYRDIGARLFISAKTVEHHVARIRRRLGAESRSEMLSMLRAMLAPAR